MHQGVSHLSFTLVTLIAVAPPGALAATYTFTPIDVPFSGVGETTAFGINNGGQVVGFYDDPTGTQAFLYDRESTVRLTRPFAAHRRSGSTTPTRSPALTMTRQAPMAFSTTEGFSAP
jgi:probable HAF family extracellular repeat protein